MDVHTSNYTLCSIDPEYGVKKDNYFAEVQFTNNFVSNVVNYVSKLKKKFKDCIQLTCQASDIFLFRA